MLVTRPKAIHVVYITQASAEHNPLLVVQRWVLVIGVRASSLRREHATAPKGVAEQRRPAPVSLGRGSEPSSATNLTYSLPQFR
jgi:hypothetical protein